MSTHDMTPVAGPSGDADEVRLLRIYLAEWHSLSAEDGKELRRLCAERDALRTRAKKAEEALARIEKSSCEEKDSVKAGHPADVFFAERIWSYCRCTGPSHLT